MNLLYIHVSQEIRQIPRFMATVVKNGLYSLATTILNVHFLILRPRINLTAYQNFFCFHFRNLLTNSYKK